MSRAIVMIFISMCHFSGFAQKPAVSGYLGQMNYGMLKLNTGIRTQHPEKSKTFDEVSSTNYSGISYKTELELRYGHIFSNRFMVEMITGFNSLAMDLNPNSTFYFKAPNGSNVLYHNYYGYPRLTDFYSGIGIKFFRRNKGALAPIGVYYGLGINAHRYTIHLENVIADGYYFDYALNKRTYYSNELNYGKYAYHFMTLEASAGVSSAITDVLITDMGFSLGASTTSPGFKTPVVPNTYNLDGNILDMVQSYHRIKVYFGLAYMF